MTHPSRPAKTSNRRFSRKCSHTTGSISGLYPSYSGVVLFTTRKMPENSRGRSRRSNFGPTFLNFGIFAALLMVISASSTISAIHSCNKGRFVMNSTWGAISNGPENYREDSYCVWLIEGII